MFYKQVFLCLLLFLSACVSNSRYQHRHDSLPTRIPNENELHDAIPRLEPFSKGGNKNYVVRGKYYQVLTTNKNFQETGIASWYGRKFHGHLTSNGEIYDMYAMSAAHKNLPIPSYVKVINNDNGKSVIVRVNDRGPFHPNRIIDLSYSAAYKLGMIATGTANVTIKAITNFNEHGYHTAAISETTAALETIQSIEKTTLNQRVIQIFASKNKALAESQLQNLSSLLTNNPLVSHLNIKKTLMLQQNEGIFRVLVGQINDDSTLTTILAFLKINGYTNAFIKTMK